MVPLRVTTPTDQSLAAAAAAGVLPSGWNLPSLPATMVRSLFASVRMWSATSWRCEGSEPRIENSILMPGFSEAASTKSPSARMAASR